VLCEKKQQLLKEKLEQSPEPNVLGEAYES